MSDLKKTDLIILADFGMTILDPVSCKDLVEVIEDRFGTNRFIPFRFFVIETDQITVTVMSHFWYYIYEIEPNFGPNRSRKTRFNSEKYI